MKIALYCLTYAYWLFMCLEQGMVVSGAVSCTLCPADTPFTWSVGSTGVAECRKCQKGFFFADGMCHPCTPECKFPDEYESVTCTDQTNRVCSTCDYYSCNFIGEYVDFERGCPGIMDANRPCAACTNKPPNSMYVFPSVMAIIAGEQNF